jgi:hypothetical protein
MRGMATAWRLARPEPGRRCDSGTPNVSAPPGSRPIPLNATRPPGAVPGGLVGAGERDSLTPSGFGPRLWLRPPRTAPTAHWAVSACGYRRATGDSIPFATAPGRVAVQARRPPRGAVALERANGIEPSTFSLGNLTSIKKAQNRIQETLSGKQDRENNHWME